MHLEFSRDIFRNILLWTWKVRHSPEMDLFQITELLKPSTYVSGHQIQLLIFFYIYPSLGFNVIFLWEFIGK